MAKTKAHVKDGRLVILAQDALEPGMTSMALDQAQSGGFEITDAGNGVCKLSFRPAGRKTGDLLASYASRARAERALRNIFVALGGGSSRLGKIAKIIGIVLLVLIALFVLLLILVPDAETPSVGEAPVSATTTVPAPDEPLPVGEPFPVDDFVRQTQGSE